MTTGLQRPLEECCDARLSEGCISDAAGGGRWVSLIAADGTVRIINARTGAAVLPADALDVCPPGENTTFVATIGNSTTFNIPGGGADLTAWSVRAIGAGVTVSIGGGAAVTMVDGEVLQSSAQVDHILADQVQVTTNASSQARVLHQLRT